jgi:acyl-CoA thioester hydrolase
MGRIKIDMPGNFFAKCSIPVRISDINYGNHVGNDAFVALLHEARMQWLGQWGYTELDVEGVGLIMSDLAVEFRNEAFYGDVVEVRIGCGEVSRVGFELYYHLSAKRNDELIVLAHAKTGMVCYDYAVKKVASIPVNLRPKLGA